MRSYHFDIHHNHGELMPIAKSIRNVDVLTASVIATLVGLLGLWPHLAFMNEIGEFRYFHGAYDEDTYTLGWLRGTLRSTRLLSSASLGIVYLLAGTSIDATLVLSDLVFPFLVTCAAYFAASQIVSNLPAKILISLLLVFANDLFSLGSMAVWTSPYLNLTAFSKAVSFLGPNLVPAYETSYLAVFRTPEPQLSFALMYLIFGLLARFANGPEAHPVTLAISMLAISLLPFGYTFVTFPVAMIVAGSTVVFVIYRRRRAAVAMVVGLLGAVVISIGAYWWHQVGSQSTSDVAAALSYPSRRPIITPAVIASMALGSAFGLFMLIKRHRGPLALLALGCLFAPLVLSNQQILTGLMISARDWERNFSYSVLVFGVSAALPTLNSLVAVRLPRLQMATMWLLCVVVVVVVVRGQQRTILLWMPRNVEAVAVAHALASADPEIVAGSSLVLENASLGPLVQMRMGGRANVLLDFYQVGINLVPNMAPEALRSDPSPYEKMVFEYWLRMGTSTQKAEQILRSEVQQRSGMFTNYLFSFRDAWYPSSDNRAIRQLELERSVDSVISRYSNYFSEGRANILAKPSNLLSARSPEELESAPWIRNEYVGKGEIGNVTMYLYRQSPSVKARRRPGPDF